MLQSLILEQISTSGSLWTVCLLHISLPGRQDKMHRQGWWSSAACQTDKKKFQGGAIGVVQNLQRAVQDDDFHLMKC